MAISLAGKRNLSAFANDSKRMPKGKAKRANLLHSLLKQKEKLASWILLRSIKTEQPLGMGSVIRHGTTYHYRYPGICVYRQPVKCPGSDTCITHEKKLSRSAKSIFFIPRTERFLQIVHKHISNSGCFCFSHDGVDLVSAKPIQSSLALKLVNANAMIKKLREAKVPGDLTLPIFIAEKNKK